MAMLYLLVRCFVNCYYLRTYILKHLLCVCFFLGLIASLVTVSLVFYFLIGKNPENQDTCVCVRVCVCLCTFACVLQCTPTHPHPRQENKTYFLYFL